MSPIGDKVLVFPVDGDKENMVAINPSTSITLDLHGITVDHTFRGLYRSNQTAGEDLLFGEVVYYHSIGKWYKTNANTDTMCDGEIGLVLEDIAMNASGNIGKIVDVRDDSWSWTISAMLYISDTSGNMTETLPTTSAYQVRKVAVAISSAIISFAPDCTIIELA